MAKYNILMVEDDENIQELVAYNLRKAGWMVDAVGNGEEGLEMALKQTPDIILLDLMLPGMDGLEVCRRIKAKNPEIPIIMLTAKGEETDIIVGLEMGADDYIVKPFSPKVLIARVKAVLRRGEMVEEIDSGKIIVRGELSIHPQKHQVMINDKKIDLTDTEYRLIRYLSERPGWVFTRNQIIDTVRGEDAVVTDRAVDVQIVGLRKKLGSAGALIETVRGVGYRFREDS